LGPRNWLAIERIAAAFSWAKFAPVLVAPVPGGKFAVLDGQHRCHAAALCGFESVPACAVPIPPQAQAEAFAAVNVAVTRMTPQNVFKARLAARDDLAVRVADIATGAGCRVLTYAINAAERRAGELLCVALLERLVKAGHGPALAAVLAGLIRSREGSVGTDCWCEAIIGPAVLACAEAGLSGHDLAAFFDAHPPMATRRASEKLRASGDYGSGTAAEFLRRSFVTLMKAWARKAVAA
jgi:hypothetical protein